MEAKIKSNNRGIHSVNCVEDGGQPAGGTAQAEGLNIRWNSRPRTLGEPDGASAEQGIQACLDRLEAYQTSALACSQNNAAIDHLKGALEALDQRTQDRIERGVEGTYEP